jgi:hypothetical protein
LLRFDHDEAGRVGPGGNRKWWPRAEQLLEIYLKERAGEEGGV